VSSAGHENQGAWHKRLYNSRSFWRGYIANRCGFIPLRLRIR